MLLIVRGWILLSTLLVAGGWILSAMHELNRTGYGTLFGLALLAAVWQWRKVPPQNCRAFGRGWHKIARRFRRPLPMMFLVLVVMSLAAGLLYCPLDADSDAYRIPRVFHWLAWEQWHWIHTEDSRMNIAATGFEWLSAPIMLFTGYDRGIFLINLVSYLLLPGLVYSMFIRLGVGRSVAWWWMWLLPTGWCFVWQAHSTINDCFGTVYALASVDFALRARQSRRPGDWWLALLAAGLLTGAKQTNLGLGLVLGIALWPGLRPMCARPVATLFVLAASLLVSVLPTCVFNIQHTGDWMGAPALAPGMASCILPSPFWGIVGNAFCLTIQNLKPPFFPMADAWNAAMRHFVETPFGSHFKSFELFGYLYHAAIGESMGLFLCALTLISIVWVWRHKPARPGPAKAQSDRLVRLLWLAPWGALLVFMAKVGSYANGRQLAPYYFFFFPVLLAAPGHFHLVRQLWWRRLAVLVALGAALIQLISRNSPLFPAQTVFGWLHQKYPNSGGLTHALGSFSSRNVAEVRRHAFKSDLPADEKVIGYYSGTMSEAEPGQWQPFGIRKVERISMGDSLACVRAQGIHYVMVDGEALARKKQSLPDWLDIYDAELVQQLVLTIRYAEPPEIFYLVHLRPKGVTKGVNP